jgi:hypothetical protein
MKNKIVVLIALAMLLPSAIAFNCNSLSGGDLQVCNSIQNTNLSQTDKDLLISDIFNKNKTTPNFDFVYQWNTNLNIQNSPDGKTYSSGTIYGAWVKIISLMPSIIENNTLYSSNAGKLLTAYNYNYQLPSGTASGDCKTYYYLSSKTEQLNVYINNNLIGHDKITAFNNLNQANLNFKSELVINLRYQTDHYRDKRYCSRYDSHRRCTRYSYRCEFYNTEYKTDSLTINDQLNAKLYQNNPVSLFKITDKYFGITKVFLEVKNYTNLILSFNNSEYKYSKYIYSLNYSLPYYVLTIKAEPAEIISFNNIHVDRQNNSFYFTVADSSNCKIQLNDFFNSKLFPCDLSFNEINFSIETDKTNYFDNDTIKVYIYPDNLLVNITYANKTIIAKNYTEFKSILYENKIYANGKLVLRTRALFNKSVEDFIRTNKSILLNPVLAYKSKERNLIVSPSYKEIEKLLKGLSKYGKCKITASEEIEVVNLAFPKSKEIITFIKSVDKKDLENAAQKVRVMRRL